MDYLALADFNLVAAHGGFGLASRASGQSKATLSRRVRELETSLGVRLIERGSRSLRLTEEGAVLHARTEMPYVEIAEALQDVKAGLSRPSGRLRVSAPMLFGQTTLGPLAAAFVAAFPDVTLEVSTEDKFVDLVTDGIDVVIRVNPRPDDALVGRCFMRNRMVLVAGPDMPRPPASATRHAAATFPAVMRIGAADDDTWRVTDPDDGTERLYFPRAVLKFSTPLPIRNAVYAGAGAALVPYAIVASDLTSGRLVNWGNSTAPVAELWVLHASRRLVSPKVAAFVSFVCDYCEANLPASMLT
ncbi:LysR family transcriptional regulator [Rhodoferax koreense]|uniref:LysR family transcriptional regulator n=1 Tax=Rhodoferax koreensis TaxID=1842727 RepID=A0A1P8JTW5_9BURK|nr:LysR family transcriptional regulator [Rhodoferax koreense]APW37220.1 LysR family transcriptional regulator [Rhodoferax koreense]